MQILQKNYVTILISLLVILVIVIAVTQSFKNNPAPATTSPATAVVATSQVPATASAAGIASHIGTLHGQATATIHCTDPSGSRCQTGTNYADFGVKIYQGAVSIQEVKLNTDGSFAVKLPPGAYTIYPDYYIPGIPVTSGEWATNLPQKVTIQSGITASITFTINYTQN